MYFDPSEIGDLIDGFENLNIIRSDLPIGQVTDVTEIEVFEDAVPQRLNANLYRVKFTTSQLGGYALSNATINTVGNEVVQIEGISVFPNPVQYFLQIKSETKILKPIVRVYNIYGTLIHAQSNLDQIDAQSWASGTYFVEIKSQISSLRNVYQILKY